MFGAGENNRAESIFQRSQKKRAFFGFFDQEHCLVDTLNRLRLRADGNIGWIVQNFIGQLTNLFRHGGGQQNRLTLFWALRHNPSNGWHETQIEHLIGFIENNGCGIAQRNTTGLQMVFETPRGRHHNIQSARHFLNLWWVFHATDNRRPQMRHIDTIFGDIIFNLAGQLAGRHNNQSMACFWPRALLILADFFENWQNESGGFTGTSLSNANHIFAFQQKRNDFILNRCWGFIIIIAQRACEGLRQTKFSKS